MAEAALSADAPVPTKRKTQDPQDPEFKERTRLRVAAWRAAKKKEPQLADVLTDGPPYRPDPAVLTAVAEQIDCVRGQALRLGEMAKMLDLAYPPSPGGGRLERGLFKFLRDVGLTGWATVVVTGDRYTVTVDEELRAIVEGRAARPDVEMLGGQSVWAWIRSLDAELDRRRKVNHDKYHDGHGRPRWVPSEIKKLDQTEMLNWLQRQLKTVANLQ